jgi:hypothetical protein
MPLLELLLPPLNPPLSDWRGKTVWIVGASSGTLLVWCSGAPLACSVDGVDVPFSFTPDGRVGGGVLGVEVPRDEAEPKEGRGIKVLFA